MENTSPQTTTPMQADPPINPANSSPIEPVSNPATPPAKNSRFSKKLLLVLLLLLFIIGIAGVGGFYFMNQNKTTEPVVTVSPTPEPTEQTVCTQEAKLCPDGVTYVGRSGPSCEFAPCPASDSADTSNWKNYIDPNSVFQLKHPADWTEIQEESNGLQIVTFYPDGYKFDSPGIPAKNTPYLRITVLPENTGRGVNPLKIENITIEGKSYKKFYETDTSGVIETIETPSGKGVMINFLLPSGSNNKTVDSLFNQIISTLKSN